MFVVKCGGASSPKSYPTRRRARIESPDRNASVRHIETNVTFFMLADEPHRGQMKASPTEKERSRQRRPATGWTTGVLCCLNAIIILSIQSIFGNKTCKLYISGLTKPTATPPIAGVQQGLAWFASKHSCQGGFRKLIFSSKFHKMFKPLGKYGFILTTWSKLAIHLWIRCSRAAKNDPFLSA